VQLRTGAQRLQPAPHQLLEGAQEIHVMLELIILPRCVKD